MTNYSCYYKQSSLIAMPIDAVQMQIQLLRITRDLFELFSRNNIIVTSGGAPESSISLSSSNRAETT